MILVVTETRVYEVEEAEAQNLRVLALTGPIETIPQSVARSATLFGDDDEAPLL